MIVSIVLAAGGSTRMGRPKPLLPVGGRTLLAAAVQPHLDAGVDRVVIVLGERAGEVEARAGVAGDPRVTIAVNAEWTQGMSSSIRRGLAEAADADAVILALADEPGVTEDRVRRLVGAWRPGVPVVAPVHEGRPGHPVLFDRALFAELAALDGDIGAREVVRRHWGAAATIEAEPLTDVDTEADYQALLSGGAMERRARSRWPLRLILTAVLLSTGVWLWDLYHRPSGLMIRSFLQGYFLGSFVMAWINVRSGREPAA